MTPIPHRTFLALAGILVAVAPAWSAPAQPALAEDAEVFPLDAEITPDELTLGVGEEGFGSTTPVRARGHTLPVGNAPVTFEVEGPETRLRGTLPVQTNGKFSGQVFTPRHEGEYTVTLTAPDGRGRLEQRVTVHEQPDLDSPDPAIRKAAESAKLAIDELAKAVEALPPSPARDDARPKLKAAQKSIAAFAASRDAETGVATLLGTVHGNPTLKARSKASLDRMAGDLQRLRDETRRVKALTSRFSSTAVGCHQLAISGEVGRVLSFVFNLEVSLLDTAIGLSKDIIADFAGNSVGARGGGPTLAFAVAQISKNSPALHRASELAKGTKGILADLGAFLADTAFSTYCERFVGPVRGRMEAHFFQPAEWWNYSFEVSARIVLYYPKNAKGPQIPLQGRIEGVAHSFETREDALTVMFPELMSKAVQKKVHFPPVEIGRGAAQVAVFGTGATSGFVEGSGPTLTLPNGFLLPVKGVLSKDSLSLVLDAAALDIQARHRVGVLIVSPLSLVPAFTWYELPFQTAHHVFLRASRGEAMRLGLTRQGNKMVAKGTFNRPAPSDGGSRGAYTVTIEACNPGC
jgi:hypothetical protein